MILLFDIRYITMRSINNENPHFIFNNVDRYIKEIMDVNACFMLLRTRAKSIKKSTQNLS